VNLVNTPRYQLFLLDKNDKRDITAKIQDRLISLTLSDYRGFNADQLDLVLEDADGKLDLPARGVKLALYLGYQGNPLIDKGLFVVAEVSYSGAPDTVTIRATGADFKNGMKVRRDCSYHDTTLRQIIEQIAGLHGLSCLVTHELAEIAINHIDQTESDINFLTRLADENGAIATIKKGTILFMTAGRAVSASGKPLPVFTITRQSGDSHHYSVADRDSYDAVAANYLNTDSKKGGKVVFGNEENTSADYENIFVLRHHQASKQSALRAAKSKFEQLQRGVATFTINLAIGQPELFPEVPIKVAGFKKQIDAENWIIKMIQHQLNDSGLTSYLELETKLDD